MDFNVTLKSAEDKFHRELNWCIEQLEMGLAFQKTDKKHGNFFSLLITEQLILKVKNNILLFHAL